MTMNVLRLGYACAPRRRGEVVAALRLIDQIGAPAGWPAGRYLLVDTRGAGEPDLEVEYLFTSLADMEQREARLREQLRANAREERFRQPADEARVAAACEGERVAERDPDDGRDADRRDRKSTRLNSSHIPLSRMPSSA